MQQSRRPTWRPTLLDDLVGETLDPGYRRAAERRRASGVAGRPGIRLALPMMIVAGLLVALAAHRESVRAPGAAKARSALVQDVQRRTEADADLARQLDTLRRDIGGLRDQSLKNTQTGGQLSARLRALEPAAGLSALHGPGVVVRVSDAPAQTSQPVDGRPGNGAGQAGQVPEGGRVLDRDLQDVVNQLWAGGAEAVAVGGVRLTSTTAIRGAGQAILVDFRPLTSPYEVTAIGDPGRLDTTLTRSGAGRRLASWKDTYGIGFSVSRRTDASVPAATVTAPRLARESRP